MNGVDLCRAVHRDWPWSITIAVTGHASLFELVKCREAGFEDYFIKPVGSKELLKAAEHACNKLERWKQRQSMPPKMRPPLSCRNTRHNIGAASCQRRLKFHPIQPIAKPRHNTIAVISHADAA
jgi:DNA-binding response OmpR family regulator